MTATRSAPKNSSLGKVGGHLRYIVLTVMCAILLGLSLAALATGTPRLIFLLPPLFLLTAVSVWQYSRLGAASRIARGLAVTSVGLNVVSVFLLMFALQAWYVTG